MANRARRVLRAPRVRRVRLAPLAIQVPPALPVLQAPTVRPAQRALTVCPARAEPLARRVRLALRAPPVRRVLRVRLAQTAQCRVRLARPGRRAPMDLSDRPAYRARQAPTVRLG